jgi:WD40 repeat protein
MKCPKCQAELGQGDRFCSQCGHRVEAASVPPPRQTAAPMGEVRRFEGHLEEVIKVAFAPDGRALSAGSDGAVHLWDLGSGRSLRRVPGARPILAADFSLDGRRALTHDGDMHLWDVESGREISRLKNQGHATSVALSPDGRRALSAADKTVRLLDLESGRELHRFEGHKSQVRIVAFSPDGRRALSGADEDDYSADAVILWDLESGRELRRPERKMMLVAGVAFSPDGRRAVAGCFECNLYLWDVESGREIRRYEGHSGNVFCVAFSPDGRTILSSSGTDAYDADLLRDLGVDNTVRLWDAESLHEICRFDGHTGNVNSVAFSRDGRHALSGSSDKTVRLWSLPDTAGSSSPRAGSYE